MEWRKSSRSGNEGNCVELAGTLTAVRDSKQPAAMLVVDVRALVEAVKGGKFDQ
ncbi:hypothetical protein JOF56_010499 [Kibdelosporangium banguiense]|uniref:DUF397 domain-containing protein n=1 Tax=Kibdelosporangium banguiense TaxID=1365924 RepID=A0ABS4U1K9_9PSEU|nr:DUF397 domain-containing protein [Kibdelosporangium banguiense]MBP2330114.1 hypothetical protein [Kibdelosporangium banguiense]